jgi:hypothetical protein
MAKILNVKVQYDDVVHKIAATEVKEERGKLLAFDGEKKVGEFSKDNVEYWFLEAQAGA